MSTEKIIFNVFMSGCQTPLMWEKVQKMNPDMIKTVDTPYNSGRASEEWKSANLTRLNVPVFGAKIPKALERVFDCKLFREKLAEMKIPQPKMSFDTFVRNGAVKDMKGLIEKLSENDTTRLEHLPFIIRLGGFAHSLETLDPATINSQEDWENFVTRFHFPETWKDNLFFEDFLGMFGYTEEQAKNLLETKMEKKGKIVTYRDEFMNWIIKGMTCWRYTGCMTDAVVAIFATLGAKLPSGTGKEREAHVVKVLEDYAKFLESHSREQSPKPENIAKKLREKSEKFCSLSISEVGGELWVPDVHIMDCEMDDLYANAIFRISSDFTGGKLTTISQLPTKAYEKMSHVEEFLRNLGNEILTDENADNVKPILGTFSAILN